MHRRIGLASILATLALIYPIQSTAQDSQPQLSPEEQLLLMGEDISLETILQAAEHGKAVRDSRIVSKTRNKKTGSLSGKRISLSPGHGIEPGSPWGFQRGLTQNLREDKHTYEWVAEFLKPMLERAGAETLMMRAYSFTESGITIDNTPSEHYSETGSWSKGDSGDYHYAYVDSSETATATWSFNVEKDGYYPVYAKYLSSDNRAADAQFKIKHARGESVVIQNQSIKGIKSGANNGSDISQNSAKQPVNRWHYLGTFPFKASETSTVTLTNISSETNKVVIADSIQIGDGPGIYKASSGKTSGYFKWQESAQVWLKTMGLPDWVTYSDVKGRNLYSLYEGVDAQLSLHSNAFNGNNRGTQTYVYYHADSSGNLQWVQEGSWEANFAKNHLPPGTYEYATRVNLRFLDYMNAYVSKSWVGNKKLYGACFGELSPSRNAWYNNKSNPIIVPSLLIETAFHDNATDASYIADQAFRFYGARGMLAGIIQFFKGDDAVIPPLPPNKLTITAESDHLNLSWSPVDDLVMTNSKPTSYNIYTSDDGVLFDVDPLMTVTEPHAVLPITYGQTLYVRITAVNSSGESLDSLVGVGRLPKSGQKKVLYVDGVDRETKTYYDTNNFRSYARIYAPAILFNYPGSGIDFADDEAVSDLLKTNTYDAVIWSTGSTSSDTDVLPADQRDALKSLRDKGTPVVISGSDIAYALDDSSYNSDSSWLSQTLNADYVADNAYATTHSAQSLTAPEIFSGTIVYSSCKDDGGNAGNRSGDASCVHYADALKASNGATVLMNYANCTQSSCAAAILSQDQKAIFAGFPLETIVDPNERLCVIANLLSKVRGDSINSSCSPAVWTPPAENCANGIDDDENGLKDCEDPACSSNPECKTPEPEPKVEICGNGIDDDENGLKDCEDPACSSRTECQPTNPDQPNPPSQPTNPDQPNPPSQPTDPDQPNPPSQPTDPDQPNPPSQPADPDAPNNPNGDTSTVITSGSDCSIHGGNSTGSASAIMLCLIGLAAIRRRKVNKSST